MRHALLILISLLALTGWAFAADDAAAAAPTPYSIQLQNRTPDEVIPALTPFLDKGGKIQAFENRVIIQTSPANLNTLKAMVQEIDVPVKTLIITVSNGTENPSNIGGQGDNVMISTERDEDRQVNTLMVDNGQVAFINTGVTIPLVQQQFAGNDLYSASGQINNGLLPGINGSFAANEVATAAGKSLDYKNLTNGIFVRPQIVGDKVKMQVMSKNDQPITTNGASTTEPVYTTFKSETTIMVPFGEWIYFGGNRDLNELNTNDVRYSTQSRDQSQKNLWIKVELQ